MSTSLVIPTDADFMFLPAQCFSEGFNFEEWQLSNENEFGHLYSEYWVSLEPMAQDPGLPNAFELVQSNNDDDVHPPFTTDDDIRPPIIHASSYPPFTALPLLATEYDNTTMSAPTGLGLQPNLPNDIHFPGGGSVTADNSLTPATAYPLESLPSSDFTFRVAQPLYPSPRHCPAQFPATSSDYLTYSGSNAPMDNFGIMQAASYGLVPSFSSHPSDLLFVPPAHDQWIAFEPVQPADSSSNPRSGFGKRRPRVDDGSATAAAQAPPKKRRRVQATATPSPSASASRSSPPLNQIASSSRLSTSPSSPSASSSSTSISSHGASTSTSPAPSIQSSNYVHLADGRYQCKVCTGKAAFADTEKEIVRHLETAKAHNPERILCKNTVYRCPCRSPRLLGKRKDSHKRHVRSYIVAERSEAIELGDQERLNEVNAYEARLRSERLL